MNQVTKRNRLQKQLELYEAYLPFAGKEEKFKLMEEMLRMRDEIKKIHTMCLKDLQNQVFEYTITEKSKINNDSKAKTNTRRTEVPGRQNAPRVSNETIRNPKGKESRIHHNA